MLATIREAAPRSGVASSLPAGTMGVGAGAATAAGRRHREARRAAEAVRAGRRGAAGPGPGRSRACSRRRTRASSPKPSRGRPGTGRTCRRPAMRSARTSLPNRRIGSRSDSTGGGRGARRVGSVWPAHELPGRPPCHGAAGARRWRGDGRLRARLARPGRQLPAGDAAAARRDHRCLRPARLPGFAGRGRGGVGRPYRGPVGRDGGGSTGGTGVRGRARSCASGTAWGATW